MYSASTTSRSRSVTENVKNLIEKIFRAIRFDDIQSISSYSSHLQTVNYPVDSLRSDFFRTCPLNDTVFEGKHNTFSLNSRKPHNPRCEYIFAVIICLMSNFFNEVIRLWFKTYRILHLPLSNIPADTKQFIIALSPFFVQYIDNR